MSKVKILSVEQTEKAGNKSRRKEWRHNYRRKDNNRNRD